MGSLGTVFVLLNLLVCIPNDISLKSKRRFVLIPWIVWCILWLVVVVIVAIFIGENIKVSKLKTYEATAAQGVVMIWSVIVGIPYFQTLTNCEAESSIPETIGTDRSFVKSEILDIDGDLSVSLQQQRIYSESNAHSTPELVSSTRKTNKNKKIDDVKKQNIFSPVSSPPYILSPKYMSPKTNKEKLILTRYEPSGILHTENNSPKSKEEKHSEDLQQTTLEPSHSKWRESSLRNDLHSLRKSTKNVPGSSSPDCNRSFATFLY